MADSAGSDLTRHTAEVPLIDQHVHGCWLTEGNRRRFENALNEANTEPLADFDSGFDSQLGFAVRNHCADRDADRSGGSGGALAGLSFQSENRLYSIASVARIWSSKTRVT